MDYFELETAVIAWAEEKGIFEKGTPIGQAIKTMEECVELVNAVNASNRFEIKDALGDVMVTILIQAEMQGMNLEDCLEHAYKVISKRKGKMIDGQFVKE